MTPCKLLTGFVWFTVIWTGKTSPGKHPPRRISIVALMPPGPPQSTSPDTLLAIEVEERICQLNPPLLAALVELVSLGAGLRGGSPEERDTADSGLGWEPCWAPPVAVDRFVLLLLLWPLTIGSRDTT